MTGPVPPTNVRVRMVDGRWVPMECRYRGWDGETHVWEAVLILGAVPESLSIDALPPHTTVLVNAAVPGRVRPRAWWRRWLRALGRRRR